MKRIKETNRTESAQRDGQSLGLQRPDEDRHWLTEKVKDHLERKLAGITSEEECTFCHKRIRRRDWPRLIHLGLQKKYMNSMNYYFMKGVDEILNGEKTPATILFRDDVYWDTQKEYVVGYYRGKQVSEKFRTLWKYHQFNIDQPKHRVMGIFKASETYFNERRKVQEKAIKKMLQVLSDSEIENCDIHLSHFIKSNSIFVEDARLVQDRLIPTDLDKQKISIPSISVIEPKPQPSSKRMNLTRIIQDLKQRQDSAWDMADFFGKQLNRSPSDWPSFLDAKEAREMDQMRSESRQKTAARVPKLGLTAAAKKHILEASKKLLSSREGTKLSADAKKPTTEGQHKREQLKVRSDDFLQQLTQMMTPRTKLRTESNLFHTGAHLHSKTLPQTARPKQTNKSLSQSKDPQKASALQPSLDHFRQAFLSPAKPHQDPSQPLKRLVENLAPGLKSPLLLLRKQDDRKDNPSKNPLTKTKTPQKLSDQFKLKASSVKSLVEQPKSLSKDQQTKLKKLQIQPKPSKKASLTEKSAASINLFFKPTLSKKCKSSADGRRDKPDKKLKERPRLAAQPSLSRSTFDRLPTSKLNLLFASICSPSAERLTSNAFDRPTTSGTKVNIYSSDFMHTIILSKRKKVQRRSGSPRHSRSPEAPRDSQTRLTTESSLKLFSSPVSKPLRKSHLHLQHWTTKPSPQTSAREKRPAASGSNN